MAKPIYLTKSLYTQYLRCPISMWLKKHAKEELPEAGDYDLFIMGQGIGFEEEVRKTYDNAVLIQSYGQEAADETVQAVKSDADVIFQATVIADGYQVMADAFVRNSNGTWSIHEVKASTMNVNKKGIESVKSDHIPDIAFQKMVFEKAGYEIESVSLVYLDREFVKKGEIDPKKLIVTTDVTEQVAAVAMETEEQAKKAKRILSLPERPDRKECPCTVSPCGSSSLNSCPCPQYCYPDLPALSVFDIPHVTLSKAQKLYESGVRTFSQCDSGDFTERQALYIELEKSGKPHVETKALTEILEKLEYPLLFLDYETFSPAIPLFDGYTPWQQMVFQYSLHVQRSPDAELEHFEFLWDELSDPAPELAKSLEKNLGTKGTVVVWNKSFECGRNTEIGELQPKYRAYFESVNNRVFDLRDIVHNHLYMHPAFEGSESIKKVLPVLCPELSYDNLEVQDGTTALLLWNKMVHGEVDKEKTREGLLRYCERDTLAMVKLYEGFLECV